MEKKNESDGYVGKEIIKLEAQIGFIGLYTGDDIALSFCFV
ncbi:hypothetical protein [Acinetobacter genomosp. 15BJ]|nr:hypothetical protein [Acinetobacter genomosp. 15BJ]